jgi:hypothetical protein
MTEIKNRLILLLGILFACPLFTQAHNPAVAAKARSLLFLNNSCDYEEPVYYPTQINNKSIRISNETEKETGYFNVYPNPATDFVQASWKCLDNNEANSLVIFNTKGICVHAKEVKGMENTIVIPLKGFAQGVYTCSIKYSDGTIDTEKFTIAK